MKSGFIAIVGRPNVGKSTFLNAVLGEKIAITSDKPQTTRNTIRGIYTDAESQMVFLDTPGIHKAKTKLGSYMTKTALQTFNEVDAVVFLVDDSPEIGVGDRYIIDILKEAACPKYLLINKIDKIQPDNFEKLFHEYNDMEIFDKIFGTSALEGININEVILELKSRLEEGPQFFPEDMVTDQPERFIVREIIREKILHYLEQEVPHGTAVDIESYKESEKIVKIAAVIYCERKSHKGIIIGKDGKKLKGIGKSARLDLEALLGTKVYLELWVKIKENWRDSDFVLSSLGYNDKK
ncbi:MAG: GTPase Era [Anaerovoracaceae bacterium]